MHSVMSTPHQIPQSGVSAVPNEDNLFMRSPFSPEEMAQQLEQMQRTQAQLLQAIYIMQHRINEGIILGQKPGRPLPAWEETPNDYSLIVRMGFRTLRWLFLFLIGFLIACVMSASLQAKPVVDTLLSIMPAMLPPLIVLTLCVIAGAAILESLK
jgi:hypothetical protein